MSSAFLRASARDIPEMSAGIIVFSRLENSGSRWWNWKTKPTLRLRKSASFFSSHSKMFTPSYRKLPSVG